MSKKLKELTFEDLEGSITHLFYELDTLKEISILLSENPSAKGTEHNALVESFVIHARGLIAFLFYERREGDDVMANNYFQYREWEELIGIDESSKLKDCMPSILRDTLERGNKEVAHITTFRVGKKLIEKQWEHVQITSEIYRHFMLFFKNVSKEYIDEKIMSSFLINYDAISKRPIAINYHSADTSMRST